MITKETLSYTPFVGVSTLVLSPDEQLAQAELRQFIGEYTANALVRVIRTSAERGDADGRYLLGTMYAAGLAAGTSIPMDYGEAFKWLRLAAEGGHSLSQAVLGGMYKEGVGVPRDYVEAHKWLNLAASQFDLARGRDLFAGERDALSKKMTPEQLAEAQKHAREWKPQTP